MHMKGASGSRQTAMNDPGAQQPSQLSYQANWELVDMWANDKPVDDGYRSIYIDDFNTGDPFL